MDSVAPAELTAAPPFRDRIDIPVRFKWNLSDIFPGWPAWEAAYGELETRIGEYAALQGTLGHGADRLLTAMKLSDDIGQLTYKVWYFASLKHDEDQRDNQINARRQQVQILFAKAGQASAWFNPEMLGIPLSTVRQWMANDAYAALSTADIKHPTVRLSTGGEVTLTYGQYRAILATNRSQSDRAAVFAEYHKLYEANVNTYASLYNSVLQRDWFHSQSRGYRSTLDAALHGNNIPNEVVTNLIDTTKANTEPLRRYHRLRKRALGVDTYHSYDTTIPLVDFDRKYPYDEVLQWLDASVAPLGKDYRRQLRDALAADWIDVYENPGKRSGAYSAPVYGVHPYMLLNYNDTLDAVFSLALEMGHSMHTLLSNAHQPFVYSAYTIFVAEVPSTLSEALVLEYMLAQATDERERIVLLQHAIDGIVGTFYTQVLFADYELQAHALAEQGRPVTAEALAEIYVSLLKAYHGDSMDHDNQARVTWARIPHFYSTPYYVYQYATCFASSAQMMKQLTTGSEADRAAAIDRYLTLLKSGGSDHPMPLLKRAGVDLSKPETVRAVVDQLDDLVTKLEQALKKLES